MEGKELKQEEILTGDLKPNEKKQKDEIQGKPVLYGTWEKGIALRDQLREQISEQSKLFRMLDPEEAFDEMLRLHDEKVARFLARFSFLFVVLVAVILLEDIFGVIDLPVWGLACVIAMGVCAFVVSNVIFRLNRSFRLGGYLTVLSYNFLIMLIGASTEIEISMGFCLPIIVSCFYMDKKLTRNISIIGYLSMAVSMLGRFNSIYTPNNPFHSGSEMHFSLLPFINTSVEYILVAVLAYCVTDYVRKLCEDREKADMANSAKSAFLANTIHEVRTPMNAILGYSGMILEEQTTEQIRDYAGNIQMASRNALDLINDVLDYSKIESGKLDIVDDEYDTAELFYEVVNIMQVPVTGKGLRFELDLDKKIPAKLYGDNKRVRQILVNILNNAAKYTREGYVRFRAQAQMMPDQMAELTFTIEDSGIGIKEEDMGKLFRKFEQLDSQKNKGIEGTGLGLSITYDLVRMMNGNISVESVYEEGSTFTIKITQKVIDRSPMGDYRNYKCQKNAGGEMQGQEKVTFPGRRILVVDDNKTNLVIASSLMKRYQMQIDTVSSGQEAIESVKKTAYDAVFMDQMMPEMDGITAMKKLRELEQNKNERLPIILLTANARDGMRESVIKQGFQDYLAKPIEISMLESVLKGLFAAA